MNKKKRWAKPQYYGRCHFFKHPGELTLKQTQEKRCFEDGCKWFEEYECLQEQRKLTKNQRATRRKCWFVG
jgi:hypothetical protein